LEKLDQRKAKTKEGNKLKSPDKNSIKEKDQVCRQDSFEAWEHVYQNQEWGKYPPEELIRFVAKNFYRAQNKAGVKILDLGCGTGACTWYLSRESFSAFGVDGSISAIRKAKQRFAAEGLKGEFMIGDIANIPYPNASFDGVIDVCSIQHNKFSCAEKVVSDVYRVLKYGGVFFSMLACDGTWTEPFEGKGYVRFYKLKDVKELFRNFEIISLERSERTHLNRTKKIRHWVVSMEKHYPE
jgi:SAM-dependent methyltransferase